MDLQKPFYAGVDQSLTSPGVVVIDDKAGIVVATTISVARDTKGVTRLALIHRELTALLSPYKIKGATLEGASYGSTHQEFSLGEVSGVVKLVLWAALSDQEPLVVPPTTAKLFATGNGLATKSQVLHAVKNATGQDFGKEDDIADAYVLARISHAIDHPTIYRRRCEQEVLLRLQQVSKPKKISRARASL